MTSTNLSFAPDHFFNDYHVYHVLDQGLAPIEDIKLELVSDFSGSYEGLSTPIELGFSLSFNGVFYKKVQVTRSGWLLLVDPASTASVALSDVMAATSSWRSDTFTTTGFTTGSGASNHVILAPWATKLRLLSSSHLYEGTDIGYRVKHGYEPPPPALLFDKIENGVRYGAHVSQKNGRAFVVRWNAYSTANLSSQVYRLKFDAIIYENGDIEFGYDEKREAEHQLLSDDLVDWRPDDAVCCAITSVVNRFRDFSYELGKTPGRSRYDFGGAVYQSTYSDAGTVYAHTLTYEQNWPGRVGRPARILFSAPKNKRKILRNNFQKLASTLNNTTTNFGRSRHDGQYYDDTQAINFVSGVFALPVGLPRLHGSRTMASAGTQDLFQKSVIITGSVPRLTHQGILEPIRVNRGTAFSETAKQHFSLSDSYYTSGSNPSLYDGLLSPSLSDKISFEYSLPVNTPTTMLTSSASAYVLNPRKKKWLLPSKTVSRSSGSLASIGFTDVYTWGTSSANIGFNAAGHYTNNRRDKASYGRFAPDAVATALTNGTTFLNNDLRFTVEQTFDVDNECLFELPISQPFLLEKVIFNVRASVDTGWLTSSTISSANGGHEFVGPTVTFALFEQEKTGDVSYRSLIASGTVSPQIDNVDTLDVYLVQDGTLAWVNVSSKGILAHNGTPSTVVPATTGPLTSSLTIKMESMISNGMTVRTEQSFNTLPPVIAYLSQSSLKLSSLNSSIVGVSPFGRTKNGLDVNGRSEFGKEFANSFYGVVENPFSGTLVGSSSLVITSQSIGAPGSTVVFSLKTSGQQCKTLQSPYLLLPGSKLFFSAFKSPSPTSTAEFTLEPGTVSAVFYGTRVSVGKENSADVREQLTSDAIHQVIADEPVLDQTIGSFRLMHSASRLDLMNLGANDASNAVERLSLLTAAKSQYSGFRAHNTFLTSSEYMTTSSVGFVYVPTPNSSALGISVFANTYKTLANIIQPPWQKFSFQRLTKASTSDERYYDTLLPSFDASMKLLGIELTYNLADAFRDIFVFLSDAPNTQASWYRSFPFEPLFSNVKRVQDFEKSIVTNKYLSFGTASYGEPTSKNRIVLFTPYLTGGYLLSTDVYYSDEGTQVRQTPTNEVDNQQAVKVLFGYGANNTLSSYDKTFDYSYMNINDLSGEASGRFVGPEIAGWKYGLRSGFSEHSMAYWRFDRFGQFRDMLEQRPYTKFIYESNATSNASDGVVTVRFVNAAGQLTSPENTNSSNLHFECTSSLPYFDGEAKNRRNIVVSALNQGIVTVNQDQFGNIIV
jgi:hypothetical protein